MLGWLPFPLAILLPFVLGVFIWKRSKTWRRRVRWRIWALLDGTCMLGIWFLWSWGFNYACPNLKTLNSWELSEANSADLSAIVDSCNSAIMAIWAQEPEKANFDLEQVEAWVPLMALSQKHWLDQVGLPNHRTVPVHALPEGCLHKLAIGGIYLPFSGQGHADAAAHWVPLAFTLAHEMSHGYGITDEGEANLAAYRTLQNSELPALHCAAWTTLLRHTLGQVRRRFPESVENIRGRCSPEVLVFLEEIRNHQKRHKPWFPGVSEAVNDAYLKQQGVKSGVDSYDEFVALVRASGPLR